MALSLEIVCPVRNGGAAFRETLRSLKGQEQPGCSLLISDNYSTDGNPWRDVLNELPEWRAEIVQPPAELGRVEHWSWALGRSSADLVKPVMAGDRLESGYVSAALAAFAAEPATSFMFCTNRILEPDKESLAGPSLPPGPIAFSTYLESALKQGNFVGTLSGVTFRGAILRVALPFEASFPWTADWRLYSRCAQLSPALYVDRPLCTLDRRIGRFSSRPATILLSLREEWRYFGELGALCGESPARNCARRLWEIGFQAAVKFGRAFVPARPRKLAGACYRALARARSPR